LFDCVDELIAPIVAVIYNIDNKGNFVPVISVEGA